VTARARRTTSAELAGDGELRVAALLRAAAIGDDAGATTLLGDDALLAAAYSNLDLLPARCATGDRVAAALRRALERL
jgi:hypothetical protein